MLCDVNASCPSDSSLCHHAKVSGLPNAYCVTSDNYDSTAGHLLALSSLLQHEGLWQVRTPHFTEGTERKTTLFARATPTYWQGATNQINPYPLKDRDVLKKRSLLETTAFIF